MESRQGYRIFKIEENQTAFGVVWIIPDSSGGCFVDHWRKRVCGRHVGDIADMKEIWKR
jgi:hypothetical protein